MNKYRKKPVVIEAIQWTGKRGNQQEIETLIGDNRPIENDGFKLKIHTLEGTMTAGLFDWIIKGVKGECYPCKPDIFEATYEKVEGGTL